MLTPEPIDNEKEKEFDKIEKIISQAIIGFYGKEAFDDKIGLYSKERVKTYFYDYISNKGRQMSDQELEANRRYLYNTASGIKAKEEAKNFIEKMKKANGKRGEYRELILGLFKDPTKLVREDDKERGAEFLIRGVFEFTDEDKIALNQSVARLAELDSNALKEPSAPLQPETPKQAEASSSRKPLDRQAPVYTLEKHVELKKEAQAQAAKPAQVESPVNQILPVKTIKEINRDKEKEFAKIRETMESVVKRFYRKNNLTIDENEIKARVNWVVQAMESVDDILKEDVRMSQHEVRMQAFLDDPTKVGGRFAASVGSGFEFIPAEAQALKQSAVKLKELLGEKQEALKTAASQPEDQKTAQPHDPAAHINKLLDTALKDVSVFIQRLKTEKEKRSLAEQKINAAYKGAKKGLLSLATHTMHQGKDELAEGLRRQLLTLAAQAADGGITPAAATTRLKEILSQEELNNKKTHFTLGEDSYQTLLSDLKSKCEDTPTQQHKHQNGPH